MEHVIAQWTTHTPTYLSLPCLQSKWGFDCYVSTDRSLKHGAAEEKTLPLPSLSPFPPFFSRPAQATRPHGRQPINYCTVTDSESRVLHTFYLQIISYYDYWGQNVDFIAQTYSPNHRFFSKYCWEATINYLNPHFPFSLLFLNSDFAPKSSTLLPSVL